jgi:hypothetical protein
MIPRHWPKQIIQVSQALETATTDSCYDLLHLGLLRIENNGFVPNVPLEKALQYLVDPSKPAMNRIFLTFQVLAFLENHRESALSTSVNSLFRKVAPAQDVILTNGRGGCAADPGELAELRKSLADFDQIRHSDVQ